MKQIKTYMTYTNAVLLLLGGLLLWRGIHDAWHFEETHRQLAGQAFPKSWVGAMAYIHLTLQISIGVGLWLGVVLLNIRPYALGMATLLFIVYTVYSELAVLDRLPRRPCACIGWWEGMEWAGLLVMNIALLLMVLIAFWQVLKERRQPMT